MKTGGGIADVKIVKNCENVCKKNVLDLSIARIFETGILKNDIKTIIPPPCTTATTGVCTFCTGFDTLIVCKSAFNIKGTFSKCSSCNLPAIDLTSGRHSINCRNRCCWPSIICCCCCWDMFLVLNLCRISIHACVLYQYVLLISSTAIGFSRFLISWFKKLITFITTYSCSSICSFCRRWKRSRRRSRISSSARVNLKKRKDMWGKGLFEKGLKVEFWVENFN